MLKEIDFKIMIPARIYPAKKRQAKRRRSIRNLLLCAICDQPRQLDADDGQTAIFCCKNPMCISMKEEC